MSTTTAGTATPLSVEAQATLGFLQTLGVQGAACLTDAEVTAIGNLTLNELRGLAKAQKVFPMDGGTCGGKIF